MLKKAVLGHYFNIQTNIKHCILSWLMQVFDVTAAQAVLGGVDICEMDLVYAACQLLSPQYLSEQLKASCIEYLDMSFEARVDRVSVTGMQIRLPDRTVFSMRFGQLPLHHG